MILSTNRHCVQTLEDEQLREDFMQKQKMFIMESVVHLN